MSRLHNYFKGLVFDGLGLKFVQFYGHFVFFFFGGMK